MQRATALLAVACLAVGLAGCAVRITSSGFEAVAGSAITGTGCTMSEDGESIVCEQSVWSEGFSEGLMGTLSAVLRGVVGFFVPGSREPQTVVVKLERPAIATKVEVQDPQIPFAIVDHSSSAAVTQP